MSNFQISLKMNFGQYYGNIMIRAQSRACERLICLQSPFKVSLCRWAFWAAAFQHAISNTVYTALVASLCSYWFKHSSGEPVLMKNSPFQRFFWTILTETLYPSQETASCRSETVHFSGITLDFLIPFPIKMV